MTPNGKAYAPAIYGSAYRITATSCPMPKRGPVQKMDKEQARFWRLASLKRKETKNA